MIALMNSAPWSQFLRRRTVDDVPDYVIGGALLSVAAIGIILTVERRMNSQRRVFQGVEREDEIRSSHLSEPDGASTSMHEEETRGNENDKASLLSASDDIQSREDHQILEHGGLLEMLGAVELTVMNFPLKRGGEHLNWFAMCDTIADVDADIVALGYECEGRLAQLADACGYSFVDRKRNLMAKYPIFDSASTNRAVGTGRGVPTSDSSNAHIWVILAAHRGVAVALLTPSFDSKPSCDGDNASGSNGFASLASSGVPVFLCGQSTALGAPDGAVQKKSLRAYHSQDSAANCTPAPCLASGNGNSFTSGGNPTGGLSVSSHTHGSAVFRDSFAEANTVPTNNAAQVSKFTRTETVDSDSLASPLRGATAARVALSSLSVPSFDPSPTKAAGPCILTAGPSQTLRYDSVDLNSLVFIKSIKNNRNRSTGGNVASNVASEHSVSAGCGAIMSSFRARPAVAPPMVAVEPSVVVEGQDFVVRPYDPTCSSSSSSSDSTGDGSSNGWWIEVRVASRLNHRDSSLPCNSVGNGSSSSNLNVRPGSSALATGHTGSNIGVGDHTGGTADGNVGLSGAPDIGGVDGGVLLSWREAPGGRLCARFAGGQLSAGVYEAVLLDAITGVDLATSRFQVLSKHDPPTLELPAGARVRRGALLRIAIRNAPGWEHDWLGLFGRGVPCGSACEPLSGRIVLHGECFADLDIPTNAADRSGPLPAGDYEVRLMRDNSPTVVAQVPLTLVEDFAHASGTKGAGYCSSSSSVGSARSFGTRGSAHGSGGGSSSVCSTSTYGGSSRRPLANASQRRAALSALGAFRPSSESVPELDRQRRAEGGSSTCIIEAGKSSSRLPHGSIQNAGGMFHSPAVSPAGTPSGGSPLRLFSNNLRGESREL